MTPDSIRLDGRTVVVAGAGGGGIGTASAVLLAQAGARVIAVDRSPRGREHAEAALAATGGTYRIVDCDLGDRQAVATMIAEAEAKEGPVRGVLNVVVHDLALICDAAEIPNEIHIDLTGLEIGDTLHISQIKLPKGAKPANEDEDFTVATIVAPSAMKSEEEETAPAGEVPTVEGGEAAEGEAEGSDSTEG